MIIDTRNIPDYMAGSTLKALCYLRSETGVHATRLAKAAGITTAAITGTIDRAERAGLLRREPGDRDRRVKIITLTDQGRDLVDGMLANQEEATA